MIRTFVDIDAIQLTQPVTYLGNQLRYSQLGQLAIRLIDTVARLGLAVLKGLWTAAHSICSLSVTKLKSGDPDPIVKHLQKAVGHSPELSSTTRQPSINWKIACLGLLIAGSALAFWKLKAAPRAYRNIFVTANEYGSKNVLKALKRPAGEGSCHVGVSSLFNLNVAAVTGTETIVLFDVNSDVIEFNERVIDLLKTSEKGPDLASSLADDCMKREGFHYSDFEGRVYHNNGTLDDSFQFHSTDRRSDVLDQKFRSYLDKMLNGPFGIFHSPSAFAHLQRLAKAGKIVAMRADLTQSSEMARIVNAVQPLCKSINSIYLSNALDWINRFYGPPGVEAATNNINRLMNDQTVLIEGISDPARTDNFYDIQLNAYYGRFGKYDPLAIRSEDAAWRKQEFATAPLLVEIGAIGERS